jgi:hypothetical protein
MAKGMADEQASEVVVAPGQAFQIVAVPCPESRVCMKLRELPYFLN